MCKEIVCRGSVSSEKTRSSVQARCSIRVGQQLAFTARNYLSAPAASRGGTGRILHDIPLVFAQIGARTSRMRLQESMQRAASGTEALDAQMSNSGTQRYCIWPNDYERWPTAVTQ